MAVSALQAVYAGDSLMTQTKLAKTALALFLILGLTNVAQVCAQSGTSSALSGTLADQSAAAIAGAEVKATEVNTGAVRVVKSSGEGRFLFSQVNPGTYRIEVQIGRASCRRTG